MRPDRVVRARLSAVSPLRGAGSAALALYFDLERSRLGVDRIEDRADLGPELTPLAVQGVGKVLRLLRAARIAPPATPFALAGDAPLAARWASRAVGVSVRLALRRRTTLRFTAWTERGVLELEDVAEVREDEESLWVIRRDRRLPLRLDRAEVARRITALEERFEVLAIERAPALGSAAAPGRVPGQRSRGSRAAGGRPGVGPASGRRERGGRTDG